MAAKLVRLHTWNAKRAGAGITIIGSNGKGELVKLAGVASIEAGVKGNPPIATNAFGVKYYLVST